MIPGTTPSAPDDVGDADPALAAALAAGDDSAIAVALVRARLLVPVVALATVGEGEAEMAVPALIAADGRRALPVFSTYDALRRWRADARPVPMPGYRVVAGAVAESYAGLVLDVAGPVPHEVAGGDLRLLADVASRLMKDPSQGVVIVTEAGSVTDC